MKKRYFALVLLLLLSGCTPAQDSPAPSPAVTGTAAPPTAATPTVTPTPTPEKPWWDELTAEDLPDTVEPIGNMSSLDGPFCLALLSEEDIGLYGDGDPTAGILLRKRNYLQFFPQTYSTARYPSPELTWADVDGDEEKELAIKYLVNDTDGSIVYELHIYEWDGKEWADRAFDNACYSALLKDVLSYQYQDGYVKLVAGGSATRAWYDGEGEPKGLAPLGDLVFFRYDSSRYKVIFGLRVERPDGKTSDVATLTASLVYDGETFSLKDYRLESVGGV